MGRRTILTGGHAWAGTPGMHRFIAGNPPRLVCLIRDQHCERCGERGPIWVTHDRLWRQLSRRWWYKRLCVPCYRVLHKGRA
jgi:hypothetical protein